MIFALRTIVFYILLGFSLVFFFIVFGLALSAFRKPYPFRYKLAVAFSYVFIYFLWIICGIRFSVEGREKLKCIKKPCVIVSNHQSYWENFFMQIIMPEHSWVIKKEILSIPVFGRCFKVLEPVAIDRRCISSVSQILRDGTDKIKSKLSLVIFPEATRVPVNKNIKFKASAAKLASSTNSSVILMAHNAGLIWPSGFFFIKPGVIKVKIIEYIDSKKVASMDVRELSSYIESKVNEEKERLVKIGV